MYVIRAKDQTHDQTHRPIDWLATTTPGWRRGLCATAFLALLAVFPVSSPGSLVEKIVVVVNGVPNTFSDLRKFARTKLKQDVELDDLTAGRVPKQWLEEFITHELIRAEVKNTGIRVRDTDIDKYIQTVRKRNDLTPTQFDALLKQDGKTIDRVPRRGPRPHRAGRVDPA